MEQYQYTALPDETSYIRLLTLSSARSNASESLEISLNIVSIKRATKSGYEVLSYAWGVPNRSESVHVEQRSWKQYNLRRSAQRQARKLLVTSTLLTILQSLRSETQPRRIWIDAICIDQDNLQEHSKQILLMPDIYENSTSAIVWLGPETAQTRRGLQLLRELACYGEVDRVTDSMWSSELAVTTDQESWADWDVDLSYDV